MEKKDNTGTRPYKPPSIEEIINRRLPVRNVNAEHKGSLTVMERIAVWVTTYVGTMGFFFVILVWTAFWLGWNFLAPQELKFDRPMAFVVWLFISNLIQILLMPLIMVGQNVQGRHAELRADNDYAINVKAEREIEAIIHYLEYQNRLLRLLLRQQGISDDEIQRRIEQTP